MKKIVDMFSSPKVKNAMDYILVALVLGIAAVSIYLVVKRSSEHFAPSGDCLQALQAYKGYKCTAGVGLTDQNEVRLLREVVNKCPSNLRLEDYACSPAGSDILGGIQDKSRRPSFFPAADWANSVRGSDPTIWGSYTYPGQK